LQAVCMPYFGSVTLADVLQALRDRKALPKSGGELTSLLGDRHARPAPAVPPARRPTPALRLLEGRSHVEAALWLAARLADGLAHAHERGILHRDLKPANVLVTDEGQPMLLDFNLSEDTKRRSGDRAALAGGTLPYMAPEQLEELRGDSAPVDERSDL